MFNISKQVNNQLIWLLVDSRSVGGIESHILQVAIGLKDYQEAVKVVFLTDYGNHPLRDALHQHDVLTDTLDGTIFALCKAIRKDRPSVIHTHGYKAGILGRIMAKLNRVPVVSTYHAGEASFGKLGVYCWLDRISARLADRIFAVSPQIAHQLPETTHVVDNFIDTQNLSMSNNNQVAFVGRLSVEKGPDNYVHLASQFPNLTFHIYGDGPMQVTLSKAALKNVHFHGQQTEMSTIWPKIGLLVMPSRFEGLPMAALEAMARGIPVLASNVGALDQLIDNDINGWLVKPGDSHALAHSFCLWINKTQQEKTAYKIAAREKIKQQFSSNIAIPKLINSYNILRNLPV